MARIRHRPAPGARLRRPGTAGPWAGYILATLLAGAAGCGIFDIRDPVQPTRVVDIPRMVPSEPEAVLFNFTQAVIFRGDGLGQYDEALDSSFEMILDPLDVQELGTGITMLDKAQNVAAQTRLTQDAALPDSFLFAFGEESNLDRTDTQAVYGDLPYELLFIGSAGETVAVARGKAELTVQEVEAARWAMTRWIDQRSDTTVTLGFLHGERAAGS